MKILSRFLPGLLLISMIIANTRAQRGKMKAMRTRGSHQRRKLGMSEEGKASNSEGSPEGLLPGECEICSPDNKVRPTSLTLRYVGGGTGGISNYQSEDKASCRNQNFPDTTTLTIYGEDYDVVAGSVFTFDDGGDRLDAETDFYFSTGEVSDCSIHTSCSQPLVAGDRLGPFIIIQGDLDDCVFGESESSLCGNGVLDPGEECDDGANGDDTDGCLDNCKKSETGDPEGQDTPEECEICSPDNKVRITSLTVRYKGGGTGAISKYQSAKKATCRDQNFPDTATLTIYGEEYDVVPGTVITFDNDGSKLKAETDFYFSTGDVSECYIHTSCSQPLVEGDIIGPFVIISAIPDNCDSANPESIPRCGNGVVEAGEECDDGANGDDTDGCRDDCTICVCEATAEYDITTGAVKIDFDMCGEPPLRYDWVGIYPCDAATMTADEVWWDREICRQTGICEEHEFGRIGDEDYGFVEGQEYVVDAPIWWTYTCGVPQKDGCQVDEGFEWPETGVVIIDPNSNEDADFAFRGASTLASGCYKVLMNREIRVTSPPPYPAICGPWEESLEFIVP